MCWNAIGSINSISLYDKSIYVSWRLKKAFSSILRIVFRDISILVNDGPFRKVFGGISLSLLLERLIASSSVENDKKSLASISVILLSDRSSTRSWLRSANKRLEIILQMLFPDRNNSVTDVRPRSVPSEMVRLFPERFTVRSVVLLTNNSSESCRKRLCERSSDLSAISGDKTPTWRSLRRLAERFNVTKLCSPFRLLSFRCDSRFPDKSSSRSDARFRKVSFASATMSFLSKRSLTSCCKLLNESQGKNVIRLPASDNSVIVVVSANSARDHLVSMLSSISSLVSWSNPFSTPPGRPLVVIRLFERRSEVRDARRSEKMLARSWVM